MSHQETTLDYSPETRDFFSLRTLELVARHDYLELENSPQLESSKIAVEGPEAQL